MVSGDKSIIIRPLDDENLGAVVRIHTAVLGYSLNSRLGVHHLAFIYRNMARQNGSYVGVAFYDDRPVGIISGAINMENTKSALIRLFTIRHWLNIGFRAIKEPAVITEWRKSNVISNPVYNEGVEVTAILSTIAVDSMYQGFRIGRRLVNTLENFFILQKVRSYHLDTLVNNYSARKFYNGLGFREIDVRADSVILIKEIIQE